MERTLVMLKPDAIEKKVDGKIIERLEDAGFEIGRSERMRLDKAIVEKHYRHLKGNMPDDRFKRIVEFMCSDDIIAVILTGENVIGRIRAMAGPTFNAPPGTIRGDFGSDSYRNLIHASDSSDSAEEEIRNIFGE